MRKEFEKREGMGKKRAYSILALCLLGAGLAFAFFNYIYIPQQRIKQLEKVGLTEEQAKHFDSIFKKYADGKRFDSAYNQTVLDFAKYYGRSQELANSVFNIYSNFKDSNDFLSLAIDDQNSLKFVLKYPELVKTFNYNHSLELYSKNSTVFEELYRNISQDSRVSADKSELINFASELFLNLGYTGKVRVLVPGTNSYREEFLSKPTIQAFGNYSVALYQLGLPKHDKNDLFLLGNATMINPEIADFEPVMLKDAEGKVIVIRSSNLARDYWMLTNLLKERQGIVSQPQKYEWINRMIQQLAWNMFDDEYGPSFYDHITYGPSDPQVWQVILGFHDYMDSLPSKLERDGIGIIFPYHDSNLLKNYIADKNNRTLALFFLADIPARTFDEVNKKIINGIEGMKLFVNQLQKEHNSIMNLYTQAKINEDAVYGPTSYDEYKSLIKVVTGNPSKEYLLCRWYYWQLLGDRANHGLPNTVDQYESIDKSLKENWDKWDLIRFIYGYERYIFPGGEAEMYTFGLPLAYKAFGIPLARVTIPNNPVGTIATEWAVYIPDNVVSNLKLHGNLISLYCMFEGLEKDGLSSSFQDIRNIWPIYLWVKS